MAKEKEKELFPGLTKQKIDELKAQYKRLYITEFDDETFIWRVLTRPEYKKIVSMENLTVFDREEEICKCCVVYPENYDFGGSGAGVATLLAEQIMDKSGFSAKKAPERL